MRSGRWNWEEPSAFIGVIILSQLLGLIHLSFFPDVVRHFFWASVVGIGLLLGLVWFAGRFAVQAIRFARIPPKEWDSWLRVYETGFGRTGGWYVEQEGRRLVLLTDPRFEEMFWDSYAVEPLSTDPAERERILTDPTWWLGQQFVFRSKEFEIVVPGLVAGVVFSEPGRVLMRGLSINIRPPTLWERVSLRWRRWRRASQTGRAT